MAFSRLPCLMLISPPFLPQDALAPAEVVSTDPMADWIDWYEPIGHGVFPITLDRRWHCGMHLCPRKQNEGVHAIADGEVVAYRVAQKPIIQSEDDLCNGRPRKSNIGFVLLRHRTETDEGRTITFYSLYMHLLDLSSYLNIGAQVNNPPETGSASELPRWLCFPTDGVVAPTGIKVYRKDLLGYPGRMHQVGQIHFEIFMTEEDFSAWFERPGNDARAAANPITPASEEYWGHTYFVIPGGQRFASVPPGLTRATSAYFPPLSDGVLDDASTLYVEVYFLKGQRHTRSWLGKDGKIIPLTPSPVRDSYADYEYKLYDRATTLYPDCPSDGYEMLRFGRILSDAPILVPGKRMTWVAVPFTAERQGYIDINQDTIQKLSDADFPAFMGWQKVCEGNTPFDDDGLCDYDELVSLLNEADQGRFPNIETEEDCKPDKLVTSYIRGSEAVRQKLRGLICHAPSEWDASNIEARYQRLKEPGEFFGRRMDIDPDGYENFLRFNRKFQFMGQTPLGEGKKFWYFHPMAFIRHFRKCGWLSAEELAQCFPRKLLHLNGRRFDAHGVPWDTVWRRVVNWKRPFNGAARKYGVSSTMQRMLHWLSHVVPETAYLRLVKEEGGENKHYSPYYGRGLIQLTHLENYQRYGVFRAFPSRNDTREQFRKLGWDPDLLIAADNQGNAHRQNCADSAGFYVAMRAGMLSHMDKGVEQQHAITVSKDVNGYVRIENLNGLDARLQTVVYLQNILLDRIFQGNIFITFTWRRNSKMEPILDSSGRSPTAGGKLKYYPALHRIKVFLDRQRPK
ncbi:hypothetical protein [Cupriavidus agavae]|nr:hypothetical protein [Cupriavidus agavae]